ncbi:hypothetical protein HID58_012954 [Brassica napus]|uniref:Sm domain-containing protein n=1 Tax=Brassica napus TaxID=3708 RepID=A0ABQ8E2I9_BRANA|nr:hypothetical protein HID58_012954 [Brassica napus]
MVSCFIATNDRIRREFLPSLFQNSPSGKNLTLGPFHSLGNTEEYIDGQLTGNLGEILIRCNNVLYVRGVSEDEELGDAEQD